MNPVNVLAIEVGNTRTKLGLFLDDRLERTSRHDAGDTSAALVTARSMADALSGRDHAAIVLASVNDTAADPLVQAIGAEIETGLYRVGDDLPIPIGTHLDPETLTGVDRLLNAAAAWDRLHQACVIVSAGTAVTVDFIDGVGTFQGGAIAPGARMQLEALHAHTALLPPVQFTAPDTEAFGKNTRQAMLHGVFHGIRGLVWRLTEQYATSYGAYPQVIATGGDAEALFTGDELINAIVPDLTLYGIAAAVRTSLAQERDT